MHDPDRLHDIGRSFGVRRPCAEHMSECVRRDIRQLHQVVGAEVANAAASLVKRCTAMHSHTDKILDAPAVRVETVDEFAHGLCTVASAFRGRRSAGTARRLSLGVLPFLPSAPRIAARAGATQAALGD